MSERKRLSDILGAGRQDDLAAAWDSTTAAGEFSPLPAGEYNCRVASGGLFASKAKGTPGFKIAFEVIEGEHSGRHVWHDVWLTAAALPMTKRDLGKLGIDSLDKLSRPLPRGILARVKLALRADDAGAEYNQVRAFEVTGTEPPDAFAPAEASAPLATHPKGSPVERRPATAPPRSGGSYGDDVETPFDSPARLGSNGPYGGDRR